MPREPRMKPSEIIEDIYENFMYTSDKDVAPLWGRVYAITRFLDEQHEREESSEERLLGVDTGLPGGDITVKVYGFVKDGHVTITKWTTDKHVFENEYCNEENCTAKDDLIPHEHVFEEETTTPKKMCPYKEIYGLNGCKCAEPKEPVSERNEEEKEECEHKTFTLSKSTRNGTRKICNNCGINYSVSERNALIDELVGEVDKLIGNLNFKDMVIQILKSKKK